MRIKALQLTWHSAFRSGSGSILASTLGASATVGGLCHAAERRSVRRPQVQVDHLSLATSPILLRQGHELVSQGTGFFFVHKYAQGDVLFLITNYHVLTGEAPGGSEPPIGNNIEFFLHKSADSPADVKSIRLPLFTTEQRPIWISPNNPPDADVAILPIPSAAYRDCNINCLSPDWASADLRVRPTSRVTLIGYPYGYYDSTNQLPVWKTGSVATEPDIDFDGKPLFLVDVSAFPGMSGSPAVAVAHGTYETGDGNVSVGGIRRFLGIFASMQIREEDRYLEQLPHASTLGIRAQESLQLGHVWKARLITETVEAIDVDTYQKEVLAKLPRAAA